MKAAHLLKEGEKRLAPSPDARWDARDLLEYALNIPHSAFLHALVSDVSEEDVQRYYDLVEKRKSGEPTQYILGKAWFMGLEYDVDARVLIHVRIPNCCAKRRLPLQNSIRLSLRWTCVRVPAPLPLRWQRLAGLP